jgi:hypothetical protein
MFSRVLGDAVATKTKLVGEGVATKSSEVRMMSGVASSVYKHNEAVRQITSLFREYDFEKEPEYFLRRSAYEYEKLCLSMSSVSFKLDTFQVWSAFLSLAAYQTKADFEYWLRAADFEEEALTYNVSADEVKEYYRACEAKKYEISAVVLSAEPIEYFMVSAFLEPMSIEKAKRVIQAYNMR